MPLREEVCTTDACPNCGVVEERLYHSAALGPRPCECCGGPTHRLESTFGVVWTGPVGQRYRDKTAEGFHEPDGQYAYERKTPDGHPKLVRLETWQDIKSYAKREGLVDPRELGKNISVNAGGKSLNANMGMPGTEL
jgi:hypothetical protein